MTSYIAMIFLSIKCKKENNDSCGISHTRKKNFHGKKTLPLRPRYKLYFADEGEAGVAAEAGDAAGAAAGAGDGSRGHVAETIGGGGAPAGATGIGNLTLTSIARNTS